MPRIKKVSTVPERTPVDDVRSVRERLYREAGGDIHLLIQQSREAAEKFRDKLGLKMASTATGPGRFRRSRSGKRVNPSRVRAHIHTMHTQDRG